MHSYEACITKLSLRAMEKQNGLMTWCKLSSSTRIRRGMKMKRGIVEGTATRVAIINEDKKNSSRCVVCEAERSVRELQYAPLTRSVSGVHAFVFRQYPHLVISKGLQRLGGVAGSAESEGGVLAGVFHYDIVTARMFTQELGNIKYLVIQNDPAIVPTVVFGNFSDAEHVEARLLILGPITTLLGVLTVAGVTVS